MHGLNCPKVTEPLPRDYLPIKSTRVPGTQFDRPGKNEGFS